MARKIKTTPVAAPIRNLARLVSVSRVNYHRRATNEEFSKALQKAEVDRLKPLSRKQVYTIAQAIFDEEGSGSGNSPFSESDLTNFEHGRSALSRDKLLWVLRGVGFTHEESVRILNLYNSTTSDSLGPGPNPNIIHTKDRELLVGSYGDLAYQRMYIVSTEYITPWVNCAIADHGGFREDEIFFKIDKKRKLDLPKPLKEVAAQKKQEWAEARAANRKAPFNGPTLALESYTFDSTEDENSGERNIIRLDLIQSEYANNYAAKSSPEAEQLKWQYLNDEGAKAEFQPLPFLASGIGIAINVFCEGGKKVVLGQRSNLETFRPMEFDVAVVEGIRPDFNFYGETEDAKYINVHDALLRGLEEELGLEKGVDRLNKLSIFEFGCDLKFYQWNFLSSVTLDMSFEEVERRWQRAKSRRENNFITSIEATEASALEFVSRNPMWACGVACLLESIRLQEKER